MDFYSDRSELLLNPKLEIDTSVIKKATDRFKAHFFIASSGTTKQDDDDLKLVALSKSAILESAKAVNQHLHATSTDIWLNCLPHFHVGGLGILARATLTNSLVISLEKWDPKTFHELISAHSITLTSLVPAQVFDLSLHKLQAPKSLRAVVVGGGAINQQLYEKAVALGWPLLISYGLTECCSQVATSRPKSQNLSALQHVEAKISPTGYLMLKSQSLLSSYIFVSPTQIKIIDPKVDGWFTTEDLATIDNSTLNILGRTSDFIKIGGEGVIFSQLEKRLEEIKLMKQITHDAALIAVEDDRLGFIVHLATTHPDCTSLVEDFNASVMPYERIRKTHLVDNIPRTVLNKLCKPALLQKLFS